MKVNGINSSEYFGQISKSKLQERTESNFAGNLAESALYHQDESKNQVEDLKSERIMHYSAMTAGISAGGVSDIEKSRVTPCTIQNISYDESDYVKICIEDGCVYKAKVFEEQNKIYIEKKYEDGTKEAFEADIESLNEDSENPVELMAAETYEKYKSDKSNSIEEDYKAALMKFQEYVKDRIENGPPKFLIGSMAISIEEWDKLLAKVDEAIDDIKEEQRENQEKPEEQKEEKLSQEGGIVNGYQD